jgi:hypothetical protein
MMLHTMAERNRHPRFHPHPRRRRIAKDDTLVSGGMLEQAVAEILKRTRLDRRHDVPYLAGYSRDGKTIYIDNDLPKSFAPPARSTNGRASRVYVDRFLILHEAVEKSMIDKLGLSYQHAHQIALRVEEAAVRAAGIRWRDYDRFMRRYIKEAEDDLAKLPPDLDIKPYRDEHDYHLLHQMQKAMKAGRSPRR